MQNLKLNHVNRPLINTGDVTERQFNAYYTIVYRHLLHELNELGFEPNPVDASTISIPVENIGCDIAIRFDTNTIELTSSCSDHRHWTLIDPLEMYLRYHARFVFHVHDIQTQALRQSAMHALPKVKQFWGAYLNQDLSKIHYDTKNARFIKLVHHHEPFDFWVSVLADMGITQTDDTNY